jgi:hypothetical protein
MANDRFEHSKTFCGEDVEAFFRVGCFGVREPCVIFIGKSSGIVAVIVLVMWKSEEMNPVLCASNVG